MKFKFDYDLLNKISLWVGIISGIFAIIEVFCDTSSTFKIIYLIFVYVFIAYVILKVINKFFSIKAAQKEIYESYNDREIMCYNMMHQIYHQLRNYKNQILYRDIQSLDEDYLGKICESLCNQIAQYFKTFFSADFCVCIKLIDTDTIDNTDFGNWRLKTIARDSNSPVERAALDATECYIKNKSDYYVIVSPKYADNFFASKNLTNIEKEFLLKYKIEFKTNRKDYLKFYKSSMVLPIRIETKYVSKHLNMDHNSTHHILGFLCIDSKKTFDSDKDSFLFDAGIEAAKSYADSLYHLFENYLIKMIEKKENKEEKKEK